MTLESLYKYYSSHPESAWIMQPENVRYLYQYIKNNPIKKVLDLGTGISLSTATIALAMKAKGETDYEIHTVEQTEKCFNLAQELIPPELKEHTTFHLAHPMVWQTELIPYQYLSRFEKLPEEPVGGWDLILVDGSGPFLEGEHYIDLPNGDVMKLLLEKKLKPGTLVAWDGRWQALKLLERFFSDNFYLAFSGEGSDFKVLEVKETEPRFNDAAFKRMKELNYVKEPVAPTVAEPVPTPPIDKKE